MQKTQCRLPYLVFALALVLALLYGILEPTVGDYNTYIKQWIAVHGGQDPWGYEEFTEWENIYGPLHNLFVFPYMIHYKLPRILVILSWGLASVFLIYKLYDSKIQSLQPRLILLALITFSPFLWIRNVHYAHFDGIVALLMILACELWLKERDGLSGFALALGFLLKYYPAVVMPFMAFRSKKITVPFVLSFVLTVGVAYLGTYLKWGMSFLNPFLMNTDRPSKILSIFRFLRGSYSPARFVFGVESLDAFSTPLLVISLALLSGFLIYRKIDLLSGVVLILIDTFIFYKVGHQQFHVALYMILLFWIIQHYPLRRSTLYALSTYILFINMIDILYVRTTFLNEWYIMRELIGLPATLILIWLAVAVYRQAKLEPVEPQAG